MTFGLIAAACGGSSSTKGSTGGTPTTLGTSGFSKDDGKPHLGGSVTWALPAETSGGFCLPEAQLAISGEQVARAVYDTLTEPDGNGGYKPFLAQSITSNAKDTQWKITLRPNITFHDGSALTAQVVKNNLDAYANLYPKRHPLLFLFVFNKYYLGSTVTGPLSLTINTVPWSAFPTQLYASGRLGIMAQAQLDDTKSCETKLIGTGPFKLQDWKVNDHMTLVRNPHYWRKDTYGNQLPYLNQITFKPIVVSQQMQNSIASGNIDLALDDSSPNIVQYRDLAKQGKIIETESDKYPELSYTIFNVTQAPFNNIHARLAFVYAVNRAQFIKIRYHGVPAAASGPFGPGVMGYLADPGLPSYSPTKAKQELALYKQETGKKDLSFVYLSAGTDPTLLGDIDFTNNYLKAVGIHMSVQAVDESEGINDVIGKKYQVAGWRNHAGFDPDTEFVWWHCNNAPPAPCDNLVNFNGFNDAVINKALETGRASTDVNVRRQAYETINREFAKMVYNGWIAYSLWTIPHQKNVKGINNLPLPDGSTPFPGLTSGIDPAGVWVTG